MPKINFKTLGTKNQTKYIIITLVLAILGSAVIIAWQVWTWKLPDHEVYSYSFEEEGFEDMPLFETRIGFNGKYSLSEIENWQRPEGSVRVGVQAGHWKNEELPEELEGLKRNGAGAIGGGTNERAIVLIIAEQVVSLLKAEGIEADLLPTTIPPGYAADAFVSVHADGNNNPAVSGFKIASPRRDYSGRSVFLEEYIYEEYEAATNLVRDTSITRRMRGYYAFNWRRYDHAIHPMTPAVIVETGFLTSPNDRKIIVDNPGLTAEGIATGILRFLKSQKLL